MSMKMFDPKFKEGANSLRIYLGSKGRSHNTTHGGRKGEGGRGLSKHTTKVDGGYLAMPAHVCKLHP